MDFDVAIEVTVSLGEARGFIDKANCFRRV
jgi:hypothetical protein